MGRVVIYELLYTWVLEIGSFFTKNNRKAQKHIVVRVDIILIVSDILILLFLAINTYKNYSIPMKIY